MVTEVYSRYPIASGVKGFFWDCSACPCGNFAGAMAAAKSQTVWGMGRSSNHESRRGR